MSTMKNRHAGHAKRMIEILESKNVIRRCPAISIKNLLNKHQCSSIAFMAAAKSIHNYCENICRPFIGSDDEEYDEACPCYMFGCEEAAKRTWIALEEKGFI